MTEKELQMLGFTKVEVSMEESGDNPYHYYIYEFTEGLEFISTDSESVVNDEWWIEFFNTEIPVRFYDILEVQKLISIFEKAKLKTN
jgi:hypothetical protein